MHWLNSIWHHTTLKYTNDVDLIEDILNSIIQSYAEKHRYHHTLNHIETMLEFSREYNQKLKFNDEIELAILYHDIIYDPEKPDNEKESALKTSEQLQSLHFPASVIESARQLILSTEHHDLKNIDQDLKSDAAFFLDFDLYILGSETIEYHQYTRAIRKEFNVFTDEVYKPGRIQALQSFLNRERIYFTDDFYSRFEKQARKNIMQELKELNS